MRENHCVDLLRRNRRISPVLFTPFLLSLEQPTIDQRLETIRATWIGSSVDQMLGAGNHPRRSEELNVGQDESFPLRIAPHCQILDRSLWAWAYRIHNPLRYRRYHSKKKKVFSFR
jgi:hypothetical protein